MRPPRRFRLDCILAAATLSLLLATIGCQSTPEPEPDPSAASAAQSLPPVARQMPPDLALLVRYSPDRLDPALDRLLTFATGEPPQWSPAPHRRLLGQWLGFFNDRHFGPDVRVKPGQFDGLDADSVGYIAISTAPDRQKIDSLRQGIPPAHEDDASFRLLFRLLLPATEAEVLAESISDYCQTDEEQCPRISSIEAADGHVRLDYISMSPHSPDLPRRDLPSPGVAHRPFDRMTAPVRDFWSSPDAVDVYLSPRAAIAQTITQSFQAQARMSGPDWDAWKWESIALLLRQIGYETVAPRERGDLLLSLRTDDASGLGLRAVQSLTEHGQEVAEAGGPPDLPDIAIEDPVIDLQLGMPTPEQYDLAVQPDWADASELPFDKFLEDEAFAATAVGLFYYPVGYVDGLIDWLDRSATPAPVRGIASRAAALRGIRLALGFAPESNGQLHGGLALAVDKDVSWPIDRAVQMLRQATGLRFETDTTTTPSGLKLHRVTVNGGLDLFSEETSPATNDLNVELGGLTESRMLAPLLDAAVSEPLRRLSTATVDNRKSKTGRAWCLRVGPSDADASSSCDAPDSSAVLAASTPRPTGCQRALRRTSRQLARDIVGTFDLFEGVEPAKAVDGLKERIDAAFDRVDCSTQPDIKARVIAGWTDLRANYLADKAGDCEAAHKLWKQACDAGLERSCRRAELAAEGRCDER